jgi:hypothetical protein
VTQGNGEIAMEAEACGLVVEIVRLLGKALDTGPRSRLSPNEKVELNAAVEYLIAYDSDPQVRGLLQALVGADLNMGLADRLRQTY